MDRSEVDPKIISHEDANAKQLVWLIRADGSRELISPGRICKRYGISKQTLRYRRKRAGLADEIPEALLFDVANRFPGKVAKIVPPQPKAEPEPKPKPMPPPFLLLPDNTRHRAIDLEAMFDVPASTLSKWKLAGRTTLHRDELKAAARGKRNGTFVDQPKEPPPPVPRNIHDVHYQPTQAERAMLRF